MYVSRTTKDDFHEHMVRRLEWFPLLRTPAYTSTSSVGDNCKTRPRESNRSLGTSQRKREVLTFVSEWDEQHPAKDAGLTNNTNTASPNAASGVSLKAVEL